MRTERVQVPPGASKPVTWARSNPMNKLLHELPCPRCQGTGKVHALDGIEFRRRREHHGFTLRAAAGFLEISPTHLSDIEAGRREPSEELLKKLLALVPTALVRHK